MRSTRKATRRASSACLDPRQQLQRLAAGRGRVDQQGQRHPRDLHRARSLVGGRRRGRRRAGGATEKLPSPAAPASTGSIPRRREPPAQQRAARGRAGVAAPGCEARIRWPPGRSTRADLGRRRAARRAAATRSKESSGKGSERGVAVLEGDPALGVEADPRASPRAIASSEAVDAAHPRAAGTRGRGRAPPSPSPHRPRGPAPGSRDVRGPRRRAGSAAGSGTARSIASRAGEPIL